MYAPRTAARAIPVAVTATLLALVAATPASAATVVEPPKVTSSNPLPVFTAGTRVTFTFTADAHGETPASFTFRLNDGRTNTVRAKAGEACVSLVIPARRTSFLLVTAVADDGSTSFESRSQLTTVAAAPYADKDFDGDGAPDLLTVGGTPTLGSGLWLSTSTADADAASGKIHVHPSNIGAKGPGNNPDVAAFDGAQVVTGHFSGTGFEDVVVYHPTGPNAGGGSLIWGNGDGSVLRGDLSGNQGTMSGGALSDLNGDDPLRLANGYHAAGGDSVYDDLVGISGDAASGYYLAYYPSSYAPRTWNSLQLPAATPTGGADWNNWTLASAKLAGGTALYLRNQTTGDLYLWESVQVTDNGDMTGQVSYTQYQVATNWNKGVALRGLVAADVNADGTPDLWAVTPAGDVTAYLVSGLSATGPATVKAQKTQHLS